MFVIIRKCKKQSRIPIAKLIQKTELPGGSIINSTCHAMTAINCNSAGKGNRFNTLHLEAYSATARTISARKTLKTSAAITTTSSSVHRHLLYFLYVLYGILKLRQPEPAPEKIDAPIPKYSAILSAV